MDVNKLNDLDELEISSIFQTLINPQERRKLGVYYTSKKNIFKLINPLFLDNLYKEFEQIKSNRHKLQEFHNKIASLKFLDPACGCGNFLIITYRELRKLEILILKELYKQKDLKFNIRNITKVNINQFFGIEYDEFAVRIAEVAMRLIDYQMNLKVSNEFGQYFVRLPLKKSANIIHGNALQIDWKRVVNPPAPLKKGGETLDNSSLSRGVNYILGNPPFVGKQYQNTQQKIDMNKVFSGVKGAGVLDYVTAWYIKAAQYLNPPQSPLNKGGCFLVKTRCAFVSTNSISQGEQVGILWQELYTKYKIKIHFAHRTFNWSNEAKSNAAVHCIIIGFGLEDIENKRIFDYENIKGEANERKVKNINPYLTEGNDLIVLKRSKQISNLPNMNYGSMPIDNGILIFSDEEKKEFLKIEPQATKWIKPYTGAQEFINGYSRYCLWLVDISPNELKKLPEILKRVENVRKFRLESKAKSTRNFANTPALFCHIAQPDTDYLLIPRVSSERRKYIPIGFISKDVIGNDQVLLIPNANLYLFGILTSEMHMTWVKYVCGRLKSDYRYSKDIVYNNYPFPENITDKQKQKVENCSQIVLDIRAKYPNSSLADLYDPLTMPPDLIKAHQNLDKAVDLCYRSQPFVNELNRIEFLFNFYENLSTPLLKSTKKKKAK